MAASAVFFSLMSLLVKLAGRRLPTLEVVLVRAVICLILSWGWLRHAGVPAAGTQRARLLLRGLLGTVSLLSFYYALIALPLSDAVVIMNTSPILTAALAAMILRERAHPRLFVALLCCKGGVVAVTGGLHAHLAPLGVGAAFTGAMASSLVFVLIRSMGDREHPLVVVFYFPLVTVPLVLPVAIPVWVWPTPHEWAILLGVGVSTQLAQMHMTRGLLLEPAGRAISVSYLQVVLATIWGALFFGEVPGVRTVCGAALILAALYLVARRPALNGAHEL
jgi:drug/metabolite transporter (DMT)-like permease